jgi:ABC-type multidrug transport system ATPase subunit
MENSVMKINQTPVISVSRVSKTYAQQSAPAIQDISFDIYPNEKVGLIGANGSGKTTLFRLLLHLLPADSGSIMIMGQSTLEKAKQYIGYVSEHQEGLENFTPVEVLNYAGKMSLVNPEKIISRRMDLLKWAGLEGNKDHLISGFSKGMRQRLFLAAALIPEPQILLLDEPMSGLDPDSQNDFLSLLNSLKSYTILYASHQLSEVEEICNRIIILQQGKIVEDLDIRDQDQEIFQLEADPAIAALLSHFPEIVIRSQHKKEDRLKIELLAEPSRFQELLTESKQLGISIHRLKSKSILEDLYRQNYSRPH